MSTHRPKQPAEGDFSQADWGKFELLERYQHAIDTQDVQLQEKLQSEHPELHDLFASLNRLVGLAAAPIDVSHADEDATRTLDAPARRSFSSINLAGQPVEFGRYLLIEQIGRGGMGAVFRAQHPELNCEVAVKIILSGELATDDELRRFQQEAKFAAGFRHPNIVAIHDVGCADGRHFFTMDYMRGGSLATLLRKRQVGEHQVADWVLQIARAVAHLHEGGVIHRDIKPSNIVFDGEGRPCITDFGLAKVFEDDFGQTRTGDVLGTASYMSPEQASGKVRAISTRSDVYSIGAVLYELLTGKPPFAGENFLETVLEVLEREPVPPRRLRGNMDPELEQICLRCLEKNPEDRYASASDLADDLATYLRGEPVEARSVSIAHALRRTLRRYPALMAHLVVLAAVAVIVAIRNLLVTGSNPNYIAIQLLLILWAAISFALQRYQSKTDWLPWTQMIWSIVDPLFITALIYLAEPPRETLLAAYPAFVAASGLWNRQSLVTAATLTSLAGYGLLLWLEPAMLLPLHHPVIFAALILSVGLTVGFQVWRMRVLSRYV